MSSQAPVKSINPAVRRLISELLATVRLSAPHHRERTLRNVAFKLGQLCGMSLLDRRTAEESLRTLAPQPASPIVWDEVLKTFEQGATRKDRGWPHDLTESSRDPIAGGVLIQGETDVANAQRLIQIAGSELLFTRGSGWHRYVEGRWCSATRNQMMGIAIEAINTLATFSTASGDHTLRNFAEKSLSERSIRSTLSLAEHMAELPDSSLDSFPYLIGAPNGVIDLASGRLRAHDPALLIKRCTSVPYRKSSKAPKFGQFLGMSTGGNEELARLIQQAVGYSLFGGNESQLLFFLLGPTASGKSTFLGIIKDILGSYAATTSFNTIARKGSDQFALSELARLVGSRLVTTSEADYGRSLDEALVKSITGGEAVIARRLYGEPFEYNPDFNLWVAGNELPKLRETSEAFWRRVVVLPFNHTVPSDKRQGNLADSLLEEAPGILAWAVRGAVDWRANGFVECQEAAEAKSTWRMTRDHLASFLDERTTVDPGYPGTAASTLYEAYKAWCRTSHEEALHNRSFVSRLMELGHIKRKTSAAWLWRGIRLRTGW